VYHFALKNAFRWANADASRLHTGRKRRPAAACPSPLTWSWQLCCLRSQQWRNTASCRRTAPHNSRSPTAARGQGDRHQPQMMDQPDGTCGCNSWGDVWQEFHLLHPARAPLVGHKLPKNCMDVRTLCVIRKTKSELFPQECDHSPHNDNSHIRGVMCCTT